MKTTAALALTAVLVALASPGLDAAEARIEGATKAKDGQVTIKVPKGTQIKKGNDHVFLPGLKGGQVAITYVNDKGMQVAKSTEVKAPKP